MQQDLQSCCKNCKSSEPKEKKPTSWFCVSLYLALSVQFSGAILIRVPLIQDTDMHVFTCGTPKSCRDTQIHNLHFKAYKIYSVDEPIKEFSFCYA